MAFNEVEIDTSGSLECLSVNADSTKVTDDEAFELLRGHVETSNAILGMAFERNTVVYDGWEERSEKYICEPVAWVRDKQINI